MTQPIIRFQAVSKSFGAQTVLRDFSLDVEPGAFVTVIGRSGCGKTTVLKLVNGLLAPDTGRVLVQGQDVARADPVALRRHIGYAIQSVGLFPHMTVEKNIAYVPAISGLEGWKGKQRREKAAALLKQVGLDPALAGRYPRALSGGQRQRVGIARALAAGPELLLMDEPFGAVDEITRGQLQDELLRIHRESGITVLFVTHDIAEALKLGTRTLVMDAGEIQQYDTPSRLLAHPATPFVERLV
ncbi:ABC transporter ATP-binding protein, partial [uncultured Oscillibacter sp.]|uniref:ATP-binding cassette domain-containing protein n=1 Tax=uncultured Oscillibacter sp. TaxID=876091 RepID=UPI00261B05BF